MDGALARLYAATFLDSLAQAVGLPLVSEFLDLEHGASLASVAAWSLRPRAAPST